MLAGCGAVLACTTATERAPAGARPEGVPSAAGGGAVPPSRGGLDRVGRPAPDWGRLPWVDGRDVRLRDLRGQVVLIRFWTDTCPFCRATAPALARIDADYRDRGVAVIGMYHPKPRGAARSVAQVAEVARAWSWRFAVALDREWSVLDAFWLDHGVRDYTSVSFVLDRAGIIRYVHPGPEFHPNGPADHDQCRRDHDEIRETLDVLLEQPGPAAR